MDARLRTRTTSLAGADPGARLQITRSIIKLAAGIIPRWKVWNALKQAATPGTGKVEVTNSPVVRWAKVQSARTPTNLLNRDRCEEWA